MAVRKNPLPYPALIALALCLLLAPPLPVAAGNADGPTCDLRFMTVDPPGSNPTTVPGINDWRQMTGERTFDSTGFHGFYPDISGRGVCRFNDQCGAYVFPKWPWRGVHDVRSSRWHRHGQPQTKRPWGNSRLLS